MCKVMGMAGLNDTNRGGAIKLFKKMSELMTISERDGFGYATIDSNGNIFGEKWLSVSQVFKKRPDFNSLKKKANDEINNLKMLDDFVYNTLGDVVELQHTNKNRSNNFYEEIEGTRFTQGYGVIGNGKLKDAVAIIAHSRFATNSDSSIKAVHPFYNADNNVALIHNGILSNHNDPGFRKTVSKCDSEVLLHRYTDFNVNMDSREIDSAMIDVEGYFACLTLAQGLDKNGQIYSIMDIYKGDAFLDVVYVQELGINVFCTNGQLIIKACEKLGFNHSSIFRIDDLVLLRLDAVTGMLAEKQEFEWSENVAYDQWNDETFIKSKYGVDALPDNIPSYREDSPRSNVIDATKTDHEKANEQILNDNKELFKRYSRRNR